MVALSEPGLGRRRVDSRLTRTAGNEDAVCGCLRKKASAERHQVAGRRSRLVMPVDRNFSILAKIGLFVTV